MSNLYILQRYAQKAPTELPSSVLFSHTPNSLTIYDAFPKSIFHFLIIPRLPQPESTIKLDDLLSLKSLLASDKTRAKEVLDELKDTSQAVKLEIEQEMVKRYGFKWPIWTGFHSVQSMHHLHLHVLSADLCSPRMKNKKHYNSFHPELGFFLHMEEVLSWFDSEPSFFAEMATLDVRKYEKLLKEELSCWRCGSSMKNIPTLKNHLQEEWDKEATREKAKAERKRKLQNQANKDSDSSHPRKKQKPEEPKE